MEEENTGDKEISEESEEVVQPSTQQSKTTFRLEGATYTIGEWRLKFSEN